MGISPNISYIARTHTDMYICVCVYVHVYVYAYLPNTHPGPRASRDAEAAQEETERRFRETKEGSSGLGEVLGSGFPHLHGYLKLYSGFLFLFQSRRCKCCPFQMPKELCCFLRLCSLCGNA